MCTTPNWSLGVWHFTRASENECNTMIYLYKKIVQNFNTQQEEKQRSVKVNCRLSPGILLSLHRQTEVNVCRLLLSLSHPTMMRMKKILSLSHPPIMRMKEIFVTLTSTDEENERDFYHSHIHRWWEWKKWKWGFESCTLNFRSMFLMYNSYRMIIGVLIIEKSSFTVRKRSGFRTNYIKKF